ncbi:LysR family transcriptional regulator ArgP [Nocardioides yefusunii]|uniref:LysR family transcriptional regulator ArgP n=1 Tax=Nocardioides yefusunii TaxID=2500546 RepID=A0ABW1QYA1_9ACTN|nr:LysR family transcriptional regulator ArgP [Nocardioides yefusunii]
MTTLSQIDPVALRTLAVAVQLGTFEAAAKELRVTPSAISQRIKALEKRVGRVLVHRVKPLEATEAGHVLVRLALQTEALEREAVAELVAEEDAEDGPWPAVPIAVNADAMYSWFTDALVEASARRRVTFEIFRDDQTRTTERLRRGEVMAAVTSDPHPVPGCAVHRLGTMRYRALARPDWMERWMPEGPTAAAFERAPMIAFDRDDTLQHAFMRKVTRRHLTPPTTFLPSVHTFDAAVRRGMGWGMVVESHAREEVASGELVELVPGRHMDVPLYWQRWKLASPVMADLTAAVVDAAEEWLAV